MTRDIPVWNKLAFVLIMVIVIGTTLSYGTVHQPLIALFYVLVGLVVVIWAVESYVTGTISFSRAPIQVPIFVLGLYGLLQLVSIGSFRISIEPFATETSALHILLLAVLFAVMLIYVDGAARVRRIVMILTVFGFIYAFFAILQHLLSPESIYGIYRPESARPFGSFVDRDDYAAVIEMLIALPVGMLLTGGISKDKRLLTIVAVILMGSSLMLSGSRGGLLSALTAILAMIALSSKASGWKRMVLKSSLALMIFLAAVGGAVLVGGDTSMTRFAEGASSSDVSASRFTVWASTLSVIREHLPWGTGLGAFSAAFPRFDTQSGIQRFEQAHNDYLQILSDAGIPGLIIGIAFLVLFYRVAAKALRAKPPIDRGIALGAIAGCVAIFTHSIFDFVLHITGISVMFLLLLAIVVAVARTVGDEGNSVTKRVDTGEIATFVPR